MFGNPGFRSRAGGILRAMVGKIGEEWLIGFFAGIGFGVVIGFALFGCQVPILTPPTGPGTDYPCGVGWYVCPNSLPAPNRSCCLEGDVCGGHLGRGELSTCAEGMCCNEMNDVDLSRDAGRRRQYAPKTEN